MQYNNVTYLDMGWWGLAEEFTHTYNFVEVILMQTS